MVGFLATALLQISRVIQQWKNFENRLRFDKVIDIRSQPLFYETKCISHNMESSLSTGHNTNNQGTVNCLWHCVPWKN